MESDLMIAIRSLKHAYAHTSIPILGINPKEMIEIVCICLLMNMFIPVF